MKERRRKHDDAHYPMGGKRGRRAFHGAAAGRSTASMGGAPRLIPFAPLERRCKVCDLDKDDHQPAGWIRHDFIPFIEAQIEGKTDE